jgi:hypothetical protein
MIYKMEENVTQGVFVYHKSHLKYLGFESRSALWLFNPPAAEPTHQCTKQKPGLQRSIVPTNLFPVIGVTEAD